MTDNEHPEVKASNPFSFKDRERLKKQIEDMPEEMKGSVEDFIREDNKRREEEAKKAYNPFSFKKIEPKRLPCWICGALTDINTIETEHVPPDEKCEYDRYYGFCQQCKRKTTFAVKPEIEPTPEKTHDKFKTIVEKAQQLLRDPDFFKKTVREIQDKKVVGERQSIESILLVQNVRNVKNASPTSSNLHINDESGIGKDYVTKAVLKILPPEQVIIRTKITPEVFTYWHNPRWEPEWTWDGKLFYIEDVSTTLLNSDVFKVMSSGGSKATVIIKQTAIDFEVKGKPSMFITSFQTSPNQENLRRFPIVNLDPSKEQTKQILKRQSIEAQNGISAEYDEVFLESMKYIKPQKVVIPYAERLPDHFPDNVIIRTNFIRFLDYIKSSAVFHQYQRERDEHGNVIATWQDYDIARDVFMYMMKNPLTIPLTRSRQDIVNFFKDNPDAWFAVTDIHHKFPVTRDWFQKELKLLHRLGFLITDAEKREGVKPIVTIYKLKTETFILDLPKSTSINTINTINTFNTINTINSINNDSTEETGINELNELNEVSIDDMNIISSFSDKVKQCLIYCGSVIQLGHKLTRENLMFHDYSPQFIDKLIEDKLLIKLPDGSYQPSVVPEAD